MAEPAGPTTQPIDPVDPGDGAVTYPAVTAGIDPATGNPYISNPELDQYGYQTGVNGEANYDINLGMTGGLMDTVSAIENSPFAHRTYDAQAGQARATTRGVSQNEMSAYQLEQMLASGSPLMKQAAEQGMARGGSRGLMNSSMSGGAAQGAMIAGAQPFALQDATTHWKTGSENMSAKNEASLENARLATTANVANMQAGAQRDLQILQDQLTGYGDIRKAMIGIEDREDTQTETRDQNDLNRTWTSNENMLTNSLAWAQSKLDAGTKLKMSREEAFTRLMADIGGIENNKISATQRQNAIRDAMATLNAVYAKDPPGPYEIGYDPATGTSTAPDGSENTTPDTTPAGTSVVVYGGTTITTHPDGTISMTIVNDDGEVEEIFNSLPDLGGADYGSNADNPDWTDESNNEYWGA